jgi:NlpC/P60 family putative phage cell wall peptidase
MKTIASRAAVVAAAREWIGTPYHNCADIKGVGVDCGMLLVRIFVDLGLVDPFDPRPYAPDWHLHRSEETYLSHLLARARRVPSPMPGDVVLFRYGRCFSHGGLVTRADPTTIIHAFHPAKIVLEEEVGRNAELASRLPTARFFSCWSDRQ